ncbi:MAG TPA: DUF349 domain-containing protein [Flavobacterium sp.]|nr:DUF349 domain-containing protein [Flavobacterium sp.]
MLEEKMDNLNRQENEADGKSVEAIVDSPTTIIESEVEELNSSENQTEDNTIITVEVLESEISINEVPEIEETSSKSNHDIAIEKIVEANAEESEDETIRHEIPLVDYSALSLEELLTELENLVTTEKVMSVKDHVEELKKVFLDKHNHFIEKKRAEFDLEHPESNEDFKFQSPYKTKFDQLFNQYRDRKNSHFKSLQSNLKINLENRLAIVEELRNLINPEESIKDILNHFNDLRERWKNSGPIPKDKYNHVWNNYHFHVENFYDYLHLDREARDVDFKHNLEQKNKIIARVEELVLETDLNKAFRELQDLHKIWKEDIGPVSKEHREEIWAKFSELTKQIHDKREQLFEQIKAQEENNLAIKNEIITKIETLATEKVNSHKAWLAQIEKVEALRNEFFNAGRVPSDNNEQTWDAFKKSVHDFNILKNSFYKEIKKEQNDNLNKKQALVDKANELKDSTDYQSTTPLMKQIQLEWKSIGHVPKKYSDKLWTDFRAACNSYFDQLKAHKNEENSEEVESFEKKKDFLETLKDFQMTGDHKTDLDAIKALIENWKSFGKVPFNRRHIEGKFNKILDALFEKLTLSKKDSDMLRFTNKIDQLNENNDTRQLENEKIFLMRKIDELQHEIFQLENNIQFFTNTKNAKKENSIVLEVRKNIERHREELNILKDKLHQLRSL